MGNKTKRIIREDEVDTHSEIAQMFQQVFDNQFMLEAKIEQSGTDIEKIKKKMVEKKKGSVTMKTLISLVMVVLLTLPCFAAVNLNEINFDNVTSGTFDQQLRKWIGILNTDITNAAGLSNLGTGKVFYVDSGTSNASTVNGLTVAAAFPTHDDAYDSGNATANRGDVVFILQDHAESGSAAGLVDIDVAGVTVVHLGNGDNAGTYTFADTDTTFVIGAANITLVGGRYLAGISEVVAGIIVEAGGDNFTFIGTKGIYANFPEPTTSTFEFDVSIQMTTGADDVSILNCEAYSADATGATKFLDGGAGVVNRFTFKNNLIHGEYSVAPLFSDQIDLENHIAYNTITNMTAGQFGIEYTAAATGILERNNVVIDDRNNNSIDPGSMRHFENYIADSSGAAATLFSEPTPKIDEAIWAYFLNSVAGSAQPIKIWYVDSNISTSGTGTTPETAWKTIQEAITACTNSVDDWIFVMDYSGGGATITLDKSFVHIIGNANDAMYYPRIKPTGSGVPGFTFADAGDRVEIAHLVIGASDQTAAAISFAGASGGAYGNYIHDNVIGRDSDAPALQGIYIPSGDAAPYLFIENNRFYGAGGTGIDAAGSAVRIAGNATRCRIIGNLIVDVGRTATPALWLDGGVTEPTIMDNRIKFDTDTGTGSAITLGASVDDGWISGNWANDGKDAPTNNPFVDSGSTNGWSENYQGIVAVLP